MKHGSRWKGGRVTTRNGYVKIAVKEPHPRKMHDGYVYEHILIAEKALGKPLPQGAEVHHVNNERSDNRAANLVICQDHAYHALLHVRADAYRAAGDAEMRRCFHCGEYDHQEGLEFKPDAKSPNGVKMAYHETCAQIYERGRTERRRTQRRGGA